MSKRILQISLLHIIIITGCIHNCINEIANIKAQNTMEKFVCFDIDHGTNDVFAMAWLAYFPCMQS